MNCDECNCFTEYWTEEDDGNLCPKCYADLVGLSVEEVWRCV